MKQFAFDSFAHGISARVDRSPPPGTKPLSGYRDPLIVCSFGRSGTHLMIDILRHQFAAFSVSKWPGQRTSALYTSLEAIGERGLPRGQLRRIAQRSRRAIVKSHDWPAALPGLERAAPDFAAWLKSRASVIVVLRDPAIAISKLWSASCSHRQRPGPAGQIELDDFVAEQGLRWRAHLEAVASAPRTLTVKFEALAANPVTEIERVAAFVGEAPRYAAPLIIPPVRNRFEVGLGRLATRPLSSHILPSWSLRQRHELDWTPKRRALLNSIAGDVMQNIGYSLA